MAEPLTMSVTEAAKALGIGRTTTYALVKSGDIPSVKLGKRVVVPRAALERMVAKAVA